MKNQSAYFLVTHGSRDPRPQAAVNLLLQELRVKLSESKEFENRSNYIEPLVAAGTLEFGEVPLSQQILEFGNFVCSKGFSRLQVIPLFLLPGVHTMEDLPASFSVAAKALGSRLEVHVCRFLGSHPEIVQLLARQMEGLDVDAWIVLSHGSQRHNSNLLVENIAKQLDVILAYWSVSPKLEDQVKVLANAGCTRIGVLPYFLFSGSLTDTIATQVDQLKAQFNVDLELVKPLEASAALASLILDLAQVSLPATIAD